jgi:LPS export ABC transporter protein LptC
LKSHTLLGFLIALLLGLCACQQQDNSGKQLEQINKDAGKLSKLESRLLLNNAVLEQANAKGQTTWKIKVERAVYSPDKKTAQLEKITGNLFQDGKIVLQVSAAKGEVQKDAEEIILKDQIVVTDPRNKATFRSQEIEWHPREDVLIVRQNLAGTHPNLEATANEGRYYTRKQRLELIGNIIATSKKPRLQMKTEHLFWEIPQKRVISDRRLQMVRYEGKTITDQVVANRAEVDLSAKTALLRQNIEFKSIEPPVQMAAHSALWNYQDRLVTSEQPVKLVHYQDRVTLTGNRMHIDLKKKIAYLQGGVQGINDRSQAKLYANELTWKLSTQTIQATGNVIYEQQTKPKFNLTGEKAEGTLKDNKIVVTSNNRDRVVTEIFP